MMMTSSTASTNRRTSICSAIGETNVKYIPCSRSDLAVDDELEMIIRRSSINVASTTAPSMADHKNHRDCKTPQDAGSRYSFFQRQSTCNLKRSTDIEESSSVRLNPTSLDPSRLSDDCYGRSEIATAVAAAGSSRRQSRVDDCSLETSFARRSGGFLDESWGVKRLLRERRSVGSYSMMAGDLSLRQLQTSCLTFEPHKSAVDVNAGDRRRRGDDSADGSTTAAAAAAATAAARAKRNERLAGMGLLLPLKKKKGREEYQDLYQSGLKLDSGRARTMDRSPSVDRHSSSVSLLSPDRTTSRDGLLEPRKSRTRGVKRPSVDAKMTSVKCDDQSDVADASHDEEVARPAEASDVAARSTTGIKSDTSPTSDKISEREDTAYVNRAVDFSRTNVTATAATRSVRKQRRKEIARAFGKQDSGVASRHGHHHLHPHHHLHHHHHRRKNTALGRVTGWMVERFCCCCLCRGGWSIAFDPSGRLAYWWTMIVSLAFVYNFWVLVYRFSFDEIRPETLVVWFPLDYLADFVYALDIAFHFRTGFLDDGVLQTDPTKMRIHYMNSTTFYVDMLCLLPLDFLYLSLGYKSVLRCFRLVKIYRFWEFLDRTERHTNYPNVVRTFTLLHYLFAIFHWNACLVHIVQETPATTTAATAAGVVSPCVAAAIEGSMVPVDEETQASHRRVEPSLVSTRGDFETASARDETRHKKSVADDVEATGVVSDWTSAAFLDTTATLSTASSTSTKSSPLSTSPGPANVSEPSPRFESFDSPLANSSQPPLVSFSFEQQTTSADQASTLLGSLPPDFQHQQQQQQQQQPHLQHRHQPDVFAVYLQSLYQSTMVLTTVGNLPEPTTKTGFAFAIFEFVFALLLFATILGHVANIVTSISAARKEFQSKLDSVKTYMTLRRVPLRLQDRVIRWFDYLWLSKKSSDEDKTLSLLPNKLKAEIALHVHLDTLKRVEIFQNTEAGFLCDLVLRLRPVLFSPGDYICRKGEVGKEMYVVNRGRLQVVADNGKTVLATLRPGSYFGEISILNMGHTGNRRTASVRSVGYSDLFCLSKSDLWEVLKDYPTARVRLEAIAVKRMEKYKKKAPLDGDTVKGIPKSKSTPGLVESSGKVPLEKMVIRSSRVYGQQAKPTISLPYSSPADVERKKQDHGVASSTDQKSAFQSFRQYDAGRQEEQEEEEEEEKEGEVEGEEETIRRRREQQLSVADAQHPEASRVQGRPEVVQGVHRPLPPPPPQPPSNHQPLLPACYYSSLAASPISPAFVFNSPTPSSTSPFLTPGYRGASPVSGGHDPAYLVPSNFLHPHHHHHGLSVSSEIMPVSPSPVASKRLSADSSGYVEASLVARATAATANSSPETGCRCSNEAVPESANSATSSVHFFFGDEKPSARVNASIQQQQQQHQQQQQQAQLQTKSDGSVSYREVGSSVEAVAAAAAAAAPRHHHHHHHHPSFHHPQPLQLQSTYDVPAGSSLQLQLSPMLPTAVQRFGPVADFYGHHPLSFHQHHHHFQQQQQQSQPQQATLPSREAIHYAAQPLVFPFQAIDSGYGATSGVAVVGKEVTVTRLLPYDHQQQQQQQQQQHYVLLQQQQQLHRLMQESYSVAAVNEPRLADQQSANLQFPATIDDGNVGYSSRRRNSLTSSSNVDENGSCRATQRKSLAENVAASPGEAMLAPGSMRDSTTEVEFLKSRLKSLQAENQSLSRRLAESESASASENSEISQVESATDMSETPRSSAMANHLRAK